VCLSSDKQRATTSRAVALERRISIYCSQISKNTCNHPSLLKCQILAAFPELPPSAVPVFKRSPLDTVTQVTSNPNFLFSTLARTPRVAGFANLDRIRSFRLRRESPVAAPDPDLQDSPKSRGRSPGWLKKMALGHGSSKRSTSTVEDSVAMDRDSSQMDGACFGKPDAPEIAEPEPTVNQMPKFLKMSPEGTCA
jgi:hypothetical protein